MLSHNSLKGLLQAQTEQELGVNGLASETRSEVRWAGGENGSCDSEPIEKAQPPRA